MDTIDDEMLYIKQEPEVIIDEIDDETCNFSFDQTDEQLSYKAQKNKTSAQMMRAYRLRIKADPVKHQRYLERERIRNKKRNDRKRLIKLGQTNGTEEPKFRRIRPKPNYSEYESAKRLLESNNVEIQLISDDRKQIPNKNKTNEVTITNHLPNADIKSEAYTIDDLFADLEKIAQKRPTDVEIKKSKKVPISRPTKNKINIISKKTKTLPIKFHAEIPKKLQSAVSIPTKLSNSILAQCLAQPSTPKSNNKESMGSSDIVNPNYEIHSNLINSYASNVINKQKPVVVPTQIPTLIPKQIPPLIHSRIPDFVVAQLSSKVLANISAKANSKVINKLNTIKIIPKSPVKPANSKQKKSYPKSNTSLMIQNVVSMANSPSVISIPNVIAENKASSASVIDANPIKISKSLVEPSTTKHKKSFVKSEIPLMIQNVVSIANTPSIISTPNIVHNNKPTSTPVIDVVDLTLTECSDDEKELNFDVELHLTENSVKKSIRKPIEKQNDKPGFLDSFLGFVSDKMEQEERHFVDAQHFQQLMTSKLLGYGTLPKIRK